MACYHPLKAFGTSDGRVVFVDNGAVRRHFLLPCGQCIGCRLERSRQWAFRCMHEASMFDANSFVTLTYRDPAPLSLDYSDFQLFMKRVRARFRARVRFYMCGEYGDRFGRAHFHAILFNCWFDDLKFYKSSGEMKLYTSALLEELWPHGRALIGSVTFESAAYVARYCTKKITGAAARDHYRMVDVDTGEVFWRTPEFNRMSLKPGIGARWLEKYFSDVYPRDSVVQRGGLEGKPPRYYDKLLSRSDLGLLRRLKEERAEDPGWLRLRENVPERRDVREQVQLARFSRLMRNFEESGG